MRGNWLFIGTLIGAGGMLIVLLIQAFSHGN